MSVETKPVDKCRVCKGELGVDWNAQTERDPAISRCPHCNTAQLNYVVTNPESLYAPFHQSSGFVHSLLDFALGFFYMERRWAVQNAGAKVRKGSSGKLLDIGCGSGAFLNSMKSYFDVWGIEPFSHNTELYKDLHDRIQFTTLEGSTPVEGCELITFWHCLEHLEDPGDAIAYASKCLHKDGRLFISIPNFDSWQAKLFGDRWFHLVVPRHTIHFDPTTLAKFLESCGYEVDSHSTFSMEYGLSGWAQSALNALFEKDLFYEWVKSRGEFEASKAKFKRTKVYVSLIVTLLLLPVFVLVEIVAGLLGKGGIQNVSAKKKAG